MRKKEILLKKLTQSVLLKMREVSILFLLLSISSCNKDKLMLQEKTNGIEEISELKTPAHQVGGNEGKIKLGQQFENI